MFRVRDEKNRQGLSKGAAMPRFASPVVATTVAGFLFFSSLLSPVTASRAGAATVAWPGISFVLRAGGLAQPVQVTHAGDGSGTLYVVEQGGRIRTLKDGAVGVVPFLDISARVVAGGEQGLLGVAFPPGYATKGTFYVDYTRGEDGATVVARYRVTQNPDVADPASEEVLLIIDQPFGNHNGGQIAFGPDGFLYIGMGDGGSGGDPLGNAQNPETLLGKMLRIDVEGGAFPYAVPPGNPFVGTTGVHGEIWALGLRNPWRFSFDRGTGDLYIGDVGQGSFEEVDFQPASSAGGENYGWNVLEGNQCFGGTACNPLDFVPPVGVYDHEQGCAVTGGAVYRGGAYPGMEGIYFYADFCSGRVWGLSRDGSAWRNSLLLTVPFSVSSFGEDEAGNLFATDYNGGAVYEIIVTNNPPSPPALVSPQDGQAGLPTSVTFRWAPSVDPDGDPVAYLFFLDTDPSFAGTVPVPVPGSSGQTAPQRGANTLPGFLVAGIVLSACLMRPGRLRALAFLLILMGTLAIWTVPGCGGGGGSTTAPPSTTIAHTESGLAPNTTHYWKVVAEDGAGSSDSGTRTFSTGNP
jgi:glucose/arabinose dehydrogenase